MSTDHIVQLPKAVWGIKIAQTIISVLVLAFACFEVAVVPYSSYGFIIFVALFTIIALVYYFVSLHAKTKLYNWIALLVLECIALIFWLAVWALLAAGLAYLALYNSYYDNVYYLSMLKRGLGKRYTYDYSTAVAAGALVYTTLAIALIQWILFCVTLGFLAVGIHRHRKSGKPYQYGGSSKTSSPWNAAEKNEMQPVSAGGYSHNQQAPSAAAYEQQHHPGNAGPVADGTHEMGGHRY